MLAVAIIPAAGRGVRMRSRGPKVLEPLLGRPLLEWTVGPFLDSDAFAEILIACPPGETGLVRNSLARLPEARIRVRFIPGGETRQESVANCLRETSAEYDLAAVHDGARPLVTKQLITAVLNKASETGAAIAAVPLKDTVKLSDEKGIVIETPDRSRLHIVQTPQCFSRGLLVSAYEKAGREGYAATDDSALVERAGAKVHIVMGSYENIKVTTPEDIIVCEEILKRRLS